jgi:hypothetical protein
MAAPRLRHLTPTVGRWIRRTLTDYGAISRKDSVGSSRRTALPSKPVARNLVAIDCSRCIAELRLGNLNVSSGEGAHIHRINKRPFKVVRVEGRLTATLPPDIERKVNDRIGREPVQHTDRHILQKFSATYHLPETTTALSHCTALCKTTRIRTQFIRDPGGAKHTTGCERTSRRCDHRPALTKNDETAPKAPSRC